ncbi:MAG: 50S ribosomal protein L25/general stress protein Ctc [Bifidobacteriaceae bacterium]|nr:50S ribosomal protein L25/general stress protein Ctc [Bifidobacteriaceae bacterium]
MADATLTAQDRTEFGKGAARRTRRAGLIPAVIHGAGDPIHISLPGHATTLALRHANALMEITVGADMVLTLAREIQRNPVRDTIEHLDLRAVRRGQKIEVDVPVHIHGEPLVGIAILDTQNLRIEVEATAIPGEIVVDVDGLSDGETIRASQVSLPEGVSLVGDDHIVVSVSVPRSELDDEQPEEAGGEGESEEPAAE